MKKYLFLLPCLFSLIFAQRGQVREGLSVASEKLGQAVAYSLYLPPDYDHSQRSYPVVYLLHGYTDDETAWVQFGEVQNTLDREIAAGTLPPMIVVMPDAGVSWYVDKYDGSFPWEQMFVEEFIPEIESRYRIRSQKEFRAISGLSMGGHGSLVMGIKHPDLFAAVAAFSAAIYSREYFSSQEQDRYDRVFGPVYGPGKAGEARLTQHWEQNSVMPLAENTADEALKSVRWYLDCGDDDFLYQGNSLLHIHWRDRGIPHEYRIRDGAHTWTYWRTHIGKGLRFIAESFHR